MISEILSPRAMVLKAVFLEAFPCSKAVFTIAGTVVNYGSFVVKGLFWAFCSRMGMWLYNGLGCSWVDSVCFNVDVSMGVCIL